MEKWKDNLSRKGTEGKGKRYGSKIAEGTVFRCPCCDKPFKSLGEAVQHLKDDGCLVR